MSEDKAQSHPWKVGDSCWVRRSSNQGEGYLHTTVARVGRRWLTTAGIPYAQFDKDTGYEKPSNCGGSAMQLFTDYEHLVEVARTKAKSYRHDYTGQIDRALNYTDQLSLLNEFNEFFERWLSRTRKED